MANTLRLIALDFIGFKNALKRQAELFRNQLKGYKIEMKFISPYEKLYKLMVEKEGVLSGEYDLFLCLTDWMPELIKMNGLTALNPYIERDPPEGWPNIWAESLLKLQRDEKGEIYGFPYHDGPIILMYRKDLFEDGNERKKYWARYHRPLEAPKTWSEFLNVAKFFTRPEENLYGTVVGAYPDGHMNVYDFLLHLWTRGGKLLNENLRPAFNSPEGVEALQFYVDLIWKHKVAPKESLNLNCHKAGQFYLDGKAAIVWQWSGFACMAEIAEYSKIVGKTGYALVPRGDKGQHKTINVYWVLTIPAGSDQKEAAYRFLKVAASKLGDKFTTEAGAIGTRLSTWRNREIQEKWPFYRIMEDVHKNVESPPQIPEYPQINAVLNKMVDDAVKLRKPVETALNDAITEVEEILKSAGYF